MNATEWNSAMTETGTQVQTIWQVKILSIDKINHNVLRIVTEKPVGFVFSPGQATEISISKPGLQDERRPFTFTSLPEYDHLEFTIKTYPERRGVTNELLLLKRGDELILHDVFGAITYRGKGVFIAGGAGITPFISILRSLQVKNEITGNKLIFSNHTREDIILQSELRQMLGKDFINILTREKTNEYPYGRINEQFLGRYIENFDQQFYVCGPPPMMDTVLPLLRKLGVREEAMVIEI